jgi:hypothetical protein
MDSRHQMQGYSIVQVQPYQTTGGLAIWHHTSDTRLKWEVTANGGFKKYLHLVDMDVIYEQSDNFSIFKKTFSKMKRDHTIVGIWVDSGNRNTVHSVWVKDYGIRFYCYFNMTLDIFKERCTDLDTNQGYQLSDVTIYLNCYA